MKTFVRMLSDESGASAAEYALILAIVGSALAVAAITRGARSPGGLTAAGSRVPASPDGAGARKVRSAGPGAARPGASLSRRDPPVSADNQ